MTWLPPYKIPTEATKRHIVQSVYGDYYILFHCAAARDVVNIWSHAVTLNKGTVILDYAAGKSHVIIFSGAHADLWCLKKTWYSISVNDGSFSNVAKLSLFYKMAAIIDIDQSKAACQVTWFRATISNLRTRLITSECALTLCVCASYLAEWVPNIGVIQLSDHPLDMLKLLNTTNWGLAVKDITQRCMHLNILRR